MTIDRKNIINHMDDVLERAYYSPRYDALETIYDEWEANKSPIVDLLSRHPKWRQDRLAIVLDGGFSRPCDSYGAWAFISWMNKETPAYIDLVDVKALTGSAVYHTHEGSALVTAELAEALNEILKLHLPDIRYRYADNGMKVSKAIGKLCHLLELDKLPDYNKEFSKFGDSVSTYKVTRPTLISVNPLDYLTMSYGKNWNSCHSIYTKDDAGCYSAGTISYMLDGSSVICFSLDSTDQIYNYSVHNKVQRNMIHLSDDFTTVVQSRVYPQENDGAADIYGDWRAIIQDVLATCLNVPNMWTVKKGTAPAGEVIHTVTGSTHYPDYKYFENVNVSRLKGTGSGAVKIRVGHMTICPECGEEHSVHENICCDYCNDSDVTQCEYCGERIRNGDYDRIDVNDYTYCCAECAENDGYRWCDDISEYVQEHDCYYDEYSCEYFYCTDYMVQTEDGRVYRNYENAESDGYVQTDSGEWYQDHEVFYCDGCGEYHHIDEMRDVDGSVMCENCVYEEINDKLHQILADDPAYADRGYIFTRYHIITDNAEASYIRAIVDRTKDITVTLDGIQVDGYRSDYIAGRVPVVYQDAETFTLSDDEITRIRARAGLQPDTYREMLITDEANHLQRVA